jgi:hypothetical protein
MFDAANLEREIKNERRAELRRHRYSTDPIWRLTKLKDNWERRERKRRGNGA